MPTLDFLGILRTLAEHHTRFIVVGGVGAVLQGAPVATFDLDLVHARHPENIRRLIAALVELDACFRTHSGIKRLPDESHLSSPGHQLLMTRLGPLDLLGVVGKGHGYEDLINSSIEMELAEDIRVAVLNLETLIRIKEEVGGEKDLAVLPTLRRTLEERRRHGD